MMNNSKREKTLMGRGGGEYYGKTRKDARIATHLENWRGPEDLLLYAAGLRRRHRRDVLENELGGLGLRVVVNTQYRNSTKEKKKIMLQTFPAPDSPLTSMD
jgi:uroporphyrinogen-III synthase